MNAARPVELFATADDAWLWTIASLRARYEGHQRQPDGPPRPCEPDDVVNELDRLYRQKRITMTHVAMLRVWGENGRAPDMKVLGERNAARAWHEAMDVLEQALQVRGIVQPPPPVAHPGVHDTDQRERAAVRMARVDAMPQPLRSLVREHGLTVIDAFLQVGVSNTRHIRHILAAVKRGGIETGTRAENAR